MKKIIPVIPVIIICLSCSNFENKAKLQSINPLKKINESVKLSSIASDIHHIRLESSNDNLIGKIDKIRMKRDRIYILDSNGSKSLFIFNRNGKLINKVSSRGNGPGEFSAPSDFTIDEARDELYLYCSKQKKICIYDLNGNYEREWFPGLWFKSFESLGEKTFLAFTNNKFNELGGSNYDLIFFNEVDGVVKTAFQNDIARNKGKLSFSFGKNFAESKSQVLFFQTFGDTVYHIRNLTLEPHTILNFGAYTIPDYEKDDVRSLVQKLDRGRYACTVSVEFPGDNLYLNYIYRGEGGVMIKNLVTGSGINAREIINDIDGSIISVPLCCLDEYLVMVNYPEDLMAQTMNEPVSLGGIEYVPRLSDNPVLVLLKLKEI